MECQDSDTQGTDVDSPNYLSMTRRIMMKSAIPSRSWKYNPTAPYERSSKRTHTITATTEKPSFAPLASDDLWQLVVTKKPTEKRGKERCCTLETFVEIQQWNL